MKYNNKLICYDCGKIIKDYKNARVEWVKDNYNINLITEIRLVHINHSYGYQSTEKLVGDNDLSKVTPNQMYSRLLEFKKFNIIEDMILDKIINDLFEK